MRHRAHGRKLGRTTAQRKALFRSQLTSLITHERITTTVAKAKELRPLAEQMVTLARTGSLANRRRVLQTLPDKAVVGRLFNDIAPRFSDRDGGYTRIVRVGRRQGDGAELAIIEFVDYSPTVADEAAGAAKKSSLMDRAKGMFGRTSAAAGKEGAAEAAPADDEPPAIAPAPAADEHEPPSDDTVKS